MFNKMVWLILGVFLMAAGGGTAAFAKTPPDIYLTPVGQQTDAFGGLSLSRNSSGHSSRLEEKRSIVRLINLIGRSPYLFLRNGSTHTGREAAQHLRWKYSFALDRIQTASQFIENIASRSFATNQDYYIKYPDGEIYPLRDVLYNELKRIEPATRA